MSWPYAACSADDLEVGEVGLPHLVGTGRLVLELVGGLEKPVNRGFRNEVLFLVGEAPRQVAGAEIRLLQFSSMIWWCTLAGMRFQTRLGADGRSASASGPPCT